MLSTILNNKKFIETITFACIIGLASFLRFYLLPGNMPFIGDQAKDYFAAVDMVENGSIPLLGIESSMPQFRQGPVYIWLLAFLFAFVGYAPENTAYFAASVGVIAVGALYIYSRMYFGRKTALTSAAFLAVSPLAVAHSQLAFVINPIPLVSVGFLSSLMHYARSKKATLFWPSFWFGVLFQFELASAPLLLMLPIAYRLKSTTTSRFQVIETIKGLVLGLLPQIVYDITHHFRQLVLFTAWVGYRVVSFFGYKNEHMFSFDRLQQTLTTITLYLHKMISWDELVYWLVAAILITGFIKWLHQKKRNSSPSYLVWCWIVLLIAGYIVHGSPSEAYFPALFVPISLAFGWSLSQAKTQRGLLMALFLIGLVMVVNVEFITRSRVLSVMTKTSSDIPSDTWLPRLEAQQQVVSLILGNTQGPVYLRSESPGHQFPAFLDNFRYLIWLSNRSITPSGEPVWIDFGETRPQLVNTKIYYLENMTISLPL